MKQKTKDNILRVALILWALFMIILLTSSCGSTNYFYKPKHNPSGVVQELESLDIHKNVSFDRTQFAIGDTAFLKIKKNDFYRESIFLKPVKKVLISSYDSSSVKVVIKSYQFLR